jgi:adenylate cyclase class 2
MAHGGQETEIKLSVPDSRYARRLLQRAGFRVLKRRVLEANTVFDTPENHLRQGGSLLRVREAGGVVTLTYKGRAEISRHKRREELELTASNAPMLANILKRLGFLPVFRYEKYRTELQRPRQRGVAMIDETPVGVYIELEGTPQWIDRTARALGFAEVDYITLSYGRLYLDWCAHNGTQPGNMVFGRPLA